MCDDLGFRAVNHRSPLYSRSIRTPFQRNREARPTTSRDEREAEAAPAVFGFAGGCGVAAERAGQGRRPMGCIDPRWKFFIPATRSTISAIRQPPAVRRNRQWYCPHMSPSGAPLRYWVHE